LDAIVKNFAGALSIILTGAVSTWVLHDSVITVPFVTGSIMVIFASITYALGDDLFACCLQTVPDAKSAGL
jgi:hypothetical protein